MASQKRQSSNSLKEELFNEFYRFPFFKAVNLLERLFPDRKPVGKTLMPDEEVVRFSSKRGFVFPSSDISNLTYNNEEEPPLQMEVAFMGLIGPSGVLPDWYNELAIERIYHKDRSLVSFLDMFNHRLISLFYLAWKKYRLSANYRHDDRDKFSTYLLSLIGLGTPGLLEKIGLPETSLLYYFSGLLSRPASSPSVIKETLKYLSGTSVHIEQFIERILPVSPEDQTQIGLLNAELGVSAMCGRFIWECQTKFRVHLGPMELNHFLRFLPDGDMLGPCLSLVRYIAGIEYEFEIRLHLKRDEVPFCELGMESPQSPRLAWSTWLTSPGFVYDSDPYVTFQDVNII